MTQELAATTALCPVCHQAEDPEVLKQSELDETVAALVRDNIRSWRPEDGICPSCLGLFRAAEARLQTDSNIFRDGAYHILPTPLRVGADERFAGRGVTIAFLDSGFYPHPDLTEPENRVAHCFCVSITQKVVEGVARFL